MIQRIDEERSIQEPSIKHIIDSFGYESGFDFNSLPSQLDLSTIDVFLPKFIENLINKVLSDSNNQEVGYMCKLRGSELIRSPIQQGTEDGKHIFLDVDQFLVRYSIDEKKKREKLLYDIHTHEIADIGPSPRDLTNIFKDVSIFGAHFSIVVTRSKIYLLARTRQTPSLPIMEAIQYVEAIQSNYIQRFRQTVAHDTNFIATDSNKQRLLASLNERWLPEVCAGNSVGLYEVAIHEGLTGEKFILKKREH